MEGVSKFRHLVQLPQADLQPIADTRRDILGSRQDPAVQFGQLCGELIDHVGEWLPLVWCLCHRQPE